MPSPHPRLLAAAEAAFEAGDFSKATFEEEALAIDAALGWSELVEAAHQVLQLHPNARKDIRGERFERLRAALARTEEPRT